MSASSRHLVQPSDISPLLNEIIEKRGYKTKVQKLAFLNPDYTVVRQHDPFLLPSMTQAVDRLLRAAELREKVTIYCDYDVDGTTAAAVLLDALPRFGLDVDFYVPDRFKEGYGLNKAAIKQLADGGTQLIVTVDNGIVSFDEVDYANKLGVGVVVTDHHTPRATIPNAIAVVDPKLLARDYPDNYDVTFRLVNKNDELYPFLDLCGCGVAFKLVQALQMRRPDALPDGQEKWLLDLVALATVSDVVSLVDENRSIVKWGLEVIKKTRRPGIRALAAVAKIELDQIDAQSIGFVLGPRINAAGRLANARLAVKLLSTMDNSEALKLATELDELNSNRKKLQNVIYSEAIKQVRVGDSIAVAAGEGWHEGVIGIVASKVEETVERPTFVFSLTGDMAKGSGRSFGDFSIAAAINATSTLLVKGGGHAAAGGVTVMQSRLDDWCQAMNRYYQSLRLSNQTKYLYPEPDLVISDLSSITVDLVRDLSLLEPCGAANVVPTFQLKDVIVAARRTMGGESQHVRYTFMDNAGNQLQAVAFNAADRFTIMPGEFGEVVHANVLIQLDLNEWNGNVSAEGRLIKIDKA